VKAGRSKSRGPAILLRGICQCTKQNRIQIEQKLAFFVFLWMIIFVCLDYHFLNLIGSRARTCYRVHACTHSCLLTIVSKFGGVSQRENFCFIKDQTPCPYLTRSLPTQFWHWYTEWSTMWVSSKLLITEEIWPGQGLNLGLPNDTPPLYPLLHKLMLYSKLTYFKIWKITNNKMLSKSFVC
jgi:hypothetical protein